jgi:hypothetical protein
MRLLAGAALLSLYFAAMGCEDARPAAAPRTSAERNAMSQRWNALAARLEADNEPRVRARLSPDRSAELDADVVRASAKLHEARKALANSRLNFPEQALEAELETARGALDEAEGAVSKADAIRASSEITEAGVQADG